MDKDQVVGVAGLLLTGGESRRLGRDKASIRLGGRSLAERGQQLLATCADPVVVVGRARAADGPLSALVAGWSDAARVGSSLDLQGALVLAVDMPFVTGAFLRWLAVQPGTVVPVVAGRDQPLCARYDRTALDAATELVGRGGRAMHELLAGIDVRRVVADDEAQFADIDTDEDLEAALARVRADG